MLFLKRLSEKKLVGIWKHPILASWFSINDGDTQYIYNDEILVFRADYTFTSGEYSKNGALYEVKGLWRLSSDSNCIKFMFDNGETSSMDIRNFNGKSFCTTSQQGSILKFTKQ